MGACGVSEDQDEVKMRRLRFVGTISADLSARTDEYLKGFGLDEESDEPLRDRAFTRTA